MGLFRQLTELRHGAEDAGGPVGVDPRGAATVTGRAEVVAVGGHHHGARSIQVVPVDLLVSEGGAAAFPVSTTIAVPPAHLSRLSPGVTLPVRISPIDPTELVVDWSTP
jgi:hypothetical protein